MTELAQARIDFALAISRAAKGIDAVWQPGEEDDMTVGDVKADIEAVRKAARRLDLAERSHQFPVTPFQDGPATQQINRWLERGPE